MKSRIVTDDPNLLGYIDGSRTVGRGDRCGSRVEKLPESQQSEYQDGFRRGAKSAAKDE